MSGKDTGQSWSMSMGGKSQPPQDLGQILTRAVTMLQSGEAAGARDLAARAVAMAPENAACHLVMATACQNLDRHDEAERHYRDCLRLDPANVRARINLGQLLLNAERADEAVECLEQALRSDPGVLEARHLLARAYGMSGRYLDAIAEFRAVEQKAPNIPEVLKGLAKALTEAQQIEQAIEVLERANALQPGDKLVCRALGVNHAALGDFDAAERWLREAVRAAPRETDAYLQLSMINRLTAADVDLMQAQLDDDTSLSETSEAAFCYAIGAHYDREGDAERAFAALERANETMDAFSGFDRADLEAHYALMSEAADPQLLKAPPYGSASDRPVFIVGMPRSGTTLVEQVLAGHPRVFAAGERSTVAESAVALRRRSDDLMLHVDRLGETELRQLAETYLAQLPEEASSSARVTDKLPGNTAYLPLIARMFPNAHIIVCRRHPMDIAWSIFKNSFSERLGYATSLDKIAAAQSAISAFLDRWVEAMPEMTTEVLYERMVEDVETQARRIVEFCGLDWNPACLETTSVGRAVRTASVWQVRQPVYKTARGQWHRYETQLAGVAQAVAPLIDAYEARLSG